MSERYGPETRGIIEAISGLKKPAHEDMNYLVVEFDLAVVRANELYELPGWFDTYAVGRLTGTASIRINESTKGLIDLTYVKTMKVAIRRIYITNVAQPGAILILNFGGDASFEVVLGDPQGKDFEATVAGQASTAAWANMMVGQYIGDSVDICIFLTETGGVNGVNFRISGSMLGFVYRVLNAGIPVAANGTAYAVLHDAWRYLTIEVQDLVPAAAGLANCHLHKVRA